MVSRHSSIYYASRCGKKKINEQVYSVTIYAISEEKSFGLRRKLEKSKLLAEEKQKNLVKIN